MVRPIFIFLIFIFLSNNSEAQTNFFKHIFKYRPDTNNTLYIYIKAREINDMKSEDNEVHISVIKCMDEQCSETEEGNQSSEDTGTNGSFIIKDINNDNTDEFTKKLVEQLIEIYDSTTLGFENASNDIPEKLINFSNQVYIKLILSYKLIDAGQAKAGSMFVDVNTHVYDMTPYYRLQRNITKQLIKKQKKFWKKVKKSSKDAHEIDIAIVKNDLLLSLNETKKEYKNLQEKYRTELNASLTSTLANEVNCFMVDSTRGWNLDQLFDYIEQKINPYDRSEIENLECFKILVQSILTKITEKNASNN